MTLLFADTYFHLALLNPRVRCHGRAHELAASHNDKSVTTAWVLTELADALADPSRRSVAHGFLRHLSRTRQQPSSRPTRAFPEDQRRNPRSEVGKCPAACRSLCPRFCPV